MPEVLIATDLDQTLLFSPAATARLGGGLPAHAVEVLDGVLISELADVVAAGLQALDSLIVPATTRTVAQLRRIAWPAPMPWAVAASGAVILRGDEPDPDWADEIACGARGCAPEIVARAVLTEHVGTVARVRSADHFAYAVGDPATLAERAPGLANDLADLGWRTEHQERKLYVLPAALDKAPAVRRVFELAGAATVYAAGDSLLDAAMVAAADRAWVPRDSPLASRPLDAHVTITAHPGHAAAAEIVAAWSADHLRPAVQRMPQP